MTKTEVMVFNSKEECLIAVKDLNLDQIPFKQPIAIRTLVSRLTSVVLLRMLWKR